MKVIPKSGTQEYEIISDEKISMVNSPFVKMRLTINKYLIKYIFRSKGIVEMKVKDRNPCKIKCLYCTSCCAASLSAVALTAISCGAYPFYECYAQRKDKKIAAVHAVSLVPAPSSSRNKPSRIKMD